MGFQLSKRSMERLSGVEPVLREIVSLAILKTKVDFTVLEGVRSLARQRELYRAGASRTLQSRHLTGHAVDLGAWVGQSIRWDWPLYDKIALAMFASARELGVAIEWGGDWQTFRDGPHFQLSWKDYPA